MRQDNLNGERKITSSELLELAVRSGLKVSETMLEEDRQVAWSSQEPPPNFDSRRDIPINNLAVWRLGFCGRSAHPFSVARQSVAAYSALPFWRTKRWMRLTVVVFFLARGC